MVHKDPYSQGYDLPVVMYGCESWTVTPKNWCFWTMMLQKTLESPLDCKEIQPMHLKGNHSWICIGRIDVEAGEGVNRGWDGYMASPTPWIWVWVNSRISDGQGNLAYNSPWGHKDSNTTEQLNWTECFWDRKEGAQLLTEWGGGTDIKKNRIPQKLSETSYNQNGIEHGLVTDL